MSRHLGQHFLRDPRILDRIVDAISPDVSDTVIEIGPGEGALTARLAGRVGTVVAIEKDAQLAERLIRTSGIANLRVMEGDALQLNWREATGVSQGAFKIIGNVPYYISTPLIHQALSYADATVVVFLLQSEVGERICADPGAKIYGGLSVGVQSYAKAERLFGVPAGAFRPRPAVDSVVVRMTPLAKPLVPFVQRDAYRRFVTSLFGQRRKRLVRCLRNAQAMDAGLAEEVIHRADVDPDARPEMLAPEGLARLYLALPR